MLLALYPRAWRERYGAEVVRLTEELIAAGEITPAQGAFNLAAAAVAERGRSLAESRRTAAAMALAVLMAVAGSFYVTSHARTPAAVSAPRAQHALGALPAPARLVRFACVLRSGTAAGHPRWSRLSGPGSPQCARRCPPSAMRVRATPGQARTRHSPPGGGQARPVHHRVPGGQTGRFR